MTETDRMYAGSNHVTPHLELSFKVRYIVVSDNCDRTKVRYDDHELCADTCCEG